MSTGGMTGSQVGTDAAARLSDTNHGSAAGSLARTSDAATQGGLEASTPVDVSPLGLGSINDDAQPAGKRRQVSRERPVTPPGFMNQAALGERSLELSTSAEREDHSMQGAQLELVGAEAPHQRPSSRSRPALASPGVRAGLP